MDVVADWSDWLEPYGEAVPLDRAAARIASEEGGAHPEITLSHLDAIAAGLGPIGARTDGLSRLVEHLFGRLGFRGDEEDYAHPRNSCLDRVLERKRGLPILLSVVAMEVGRRVGVPLVGIGFPGHFLVGTSAPGRILLDPFRGGRSRSMAELRQELAQRLGRGPTPAELEQALAPTAPRDLLVRISTNLVRSWLERGRPGDALRNLDRRVALRPEVPELVRDRGLMRAKVGLREEAALDLGTYLEHRPEAPDAGRLRWQIAVLLRG